MLVIPRKNSSLQFSLTKTFRHKPKSETNFVPATNLQVLFCPLQTPQTSSVAFEPYLWSQPMGIQIPLIQISLVSSSRPHGVPSSTRSPRTNDRSSLSSDTLQINLHLSESSTEISKKNKIQFMLQITKAPSFSLQRRPIPTEKKTSYEKYFVVVNQHSCNSVLLYSKTSRKEGSKTEYFSINICFDHSRRFCRTYHYISVQIALHAVVKDRSYDY